MVILYLVGGLPAQDTIYTRAGPVLIAVNPFKSLPELYTPDVLAKYRDNQTDVPHVYHVVRLPIPTCTHSKL